MERLEKLGISWGLHYRNHGTETQLPNTKEMTDWHQRLALLQQYARLTSPDPACPVAAALYTPHGTFMHVDCNRLPRGMTGTPEQWQDIDWKLGNIMHAEQACLQGISSDLKCWTVVVTKYPCHECAKHLIERGIGQLICPPYRLDTKWLASHQRATEMLVNAGVTITILD